MFTGIIEALGKVDRILENGSNKTIWISSPISNDLRIDQSVSHNGVCLTVEKVSDDTHCVTAIDETLKKTNIDSWKEGTLVNMERSLQMNGRLDGHIVQGHIDGTATCISKKNLEGSWEYRFKLSQKSNLMIEKGSISINGISLTVFDVTAKKFSVAVIPYTYNHTNIQQVEPGTIVNIEFDIIGKYVKRMISPAR